MIGTHDSFTYLKPVNPIYSLFNFLWRTQSLSLKKQLNKGVKYFDIRVSYYKSKWRVSHGLVNFDLTFSSIKYILEIFAPYYVRLILEKGNDKVEELFTDAISEVAQYPNLSFACIKKGWKVLVNRDPVIKDYSYIPWYSGYSFLWNLKHFKLSSIKYYAKKHNPSITKEMIEDPYTVYFMDYVE